MECCSVALSASFAVDPATPMPMTSKVGGFVRHGNHMAHALGNVTIATRANIGLGGLIGLYKSCLDVVFVPKVSHNSAERSPDQ